MRTVKVLPVLQIKDWFFFIGSFSFFLRQGLGLIGIIEAASNS
jgi:hypothetical protein